MGNTIRQYLAEVETKLGPTVDDQTLQAILAETENHLRESAQEIAELGFSRVEAEQRAIESFGAAEEYGQAVEEVDAVQSKVSGKWVTGISVFATASLVSWFLFVQGYTYQSPGVTVRLMDVALFPVGLVTIASLFGSRVKARRLYLIAVVGGVLLTPILAVRYIGFWRGIPVRTATLRSTSEDLPGEHLKSAKAYQKGLDELDRDMRNLRRDGPPAVADHGNTFYLAPAEPPLYRLDGEPDPFDRFSDRQEAYKAWGLNGWGTRAMYVRGVEIYSGSAEDAQASLDESFLTRWLSFTPYVPFVGVAWGTFMVLLQFFGTAVRNLFFEILRRSGWTRVRSARPGQTA